MADTNHKDYENIVHDLIDNAIVPYPNAVNILLADHGDAGRWTWILGKQFGISNMYALYISRSRLLKLCGLDVRQRRALTGASPLRHNPLKRPLLVATQPELGRHLNDQIRAN